MLRHLLTAICLLICNALLAVTISATTTPSICYNDGSITASASAGSPPYTFVITNGPVIQNVTYPIQPIVGGQFINLNSGTYTVKVTDNTGATAISTVTVGGNYTFPTGTFAVNRDSIIATATGGRPGYQYAIGTNGPTGAFGPYQSDKFFAGICSGTFYVRIKDSCGNIFTSLAITVNTSPPSIISATCRTTGGKDSVYVALNPSTGVPPFTFVRKSALGNVTNSTGIFADPTPCADTLEVTDKCGRTAKLTLDCHPLQVSTVCNSCNLGTGQITVVGGTPPLRYTYSASGGPAVSITDSSGYFKNLPKDKDIVITVRDACNRTATAIFPCMTLGFNFNCPYRDTVDVTIGGGKNAFPVQVVCTNCVPPVTKTFNTAGPIPFYGPGLAEFHFTATDACNDIKIDTAVPKSKTTNKVEYTSCNDFKISVYGSKGELITTGLSFHGVVTPGGAVYDNTNGDFRNVPDGVIKIDIGVDGCDTNSISITIPQVSVCRIAYVDSACNDVYFLNLTIKDYPETWSIEKTTGGGKVNEFPAGKSNGTFFYNIPPGNYNIKSDSGCQVKLTLPAPIKPTFQYNAGVNCFGKTFVNINSNPSLFDCRDGGTILYKFSFYTSLPGTPKYTLYGNNVAMDSIDAGKYFVVVSPLDSVGYFTYKGDDSIERKYGFTNKGDCRIDTLDLIVPAKTIPFLDLTDVLVCGATSTANLPINISGGIAPFTLQISGYPDVKLQSNTGTFPNVSVGTYTLIVYDSCSISRSFTVSVVDSCDPCYRVNAKFAPSNNPVCTGENIYFANAGDSTLTYKWLRNGTVFSNSRNPSYTFTSTGTDSIMCIASKGLCSDTFVVGINILVRPVLNVGPDTSICYPFSYTIESGNSSTIWNDGSAGSTLVVDSAGVYIATVTGACGAVSDTVRVIGLNAPINILPVSDTVICRDSLLRLNLTGYSNYIWQDSTVGGTYVISQPGTYSVSATNICGTGADTIIVDTRICLCKLVIPNTFTPNGDNVNDFFLPVHICDMKTFEFRIYNRWGEQVFATDNVLKGWDGTHMNKDQPAGAYLYTLKYSFDSQEDSSVKSINGPVNLVR